MLFPNPARPARPRPRAKFVAAASGRSMPRPRARIFVAASLPRHLRLNLRPSLICRILIYSEVLLTFGHGNCLRISFTGTRCTLRSPDAAASAFRVAKQLCPHMQKNRHPDRSDPAFFLRSFCERRVAEWSDILTKPAASIKIQGTCFSLRSARRNPRSAVILRSRRSSAGPKDLNCPYRATAKRTLAM
jgi:hypothetical protein